MRGMYAATAASLAVLGAAADIQAAELLIESWRNDDLQIWQDRIIPAFNAHHPDIEVTFAPTAPREYNAALNAKLEGGTAGDLITCRPFDAALQLFQQGNLADISDLDGLSGFPDFALAAWQTDDRASTFCVPMASVIHGFMYNKDAFAELGLEVPATEEAFFTLLETIRDDGTYVPLAMGTADQWESATMGYTNIGPNYWKGEKGREALIAGEAKFTDEDYVAPFRTIARWADFMPMGYEAQSYPDSQNMFTLGRAAIYPTGSWEIAGFSRDSDFELGAFRPPVAKEGDECFISDHVDIALGMNPASKNAEAARTFLEWVTSQEFAELYSNEIPGFFSLSNHEISLDDPVAQTFMSWRGECSQSIRVAHQILSRGTPNTWNEMWVVSANVINGTQTPEEAAEQLQKGLDAWYRPGE
ncbi:MAG: carbohydrate ABC transporter substrate-binding protein [Geminicoccaceae bacterium]|nr:carbohydrate ABC transporter substrate-binding protein [Geminicoccaceae bacterium]